MEQATQTGPDALVLDLDLRTMSRRALLQLSLLIFSSIMVHMMVKASFIGNSTDYKVHFAKILVR